MKKTKKIRKRLTEKIVKKPNTIRVVKTVLKKKVAKKFKKKIIELKKRQVTAKPKHKRELRKKILKLKVIKGGKKFVEHWKQKANENKGKDSYVERVKVVEKLYGETREARKRLTKKVVKEQKYTSRAIREIKKIKKQIKKAKLPGKTKSKKVIELKNDLRKVLKLGRKTCNLNKNMKDAEQGASNVITTLEKMLEL